MIKTTVDGCRGLHQKTSLASLATNQQLLVVSRPGVSELLGVTYIFHLRLTKSRCFHCFSLAYEILCGSKLYLNFTIVWKTANALKAVARTVLPIILAFYGGRNRELLGITEPGIL